MNERVFCKIIRATVTPAICEMRRSKKWCDCKKGGIMEWLNDVEFEDLLTNDTELIAAYCGIETLIKLWENLPSMSLFISTKPLVEAKKRYIRKFYNGSNARELAVKLGVSERFVFKTLRGRK